MGNLCQENPGESDHRTASNDLHLLSSREKDKRVPRCVLSSWCRIHIDPLDFQACSTQCLFRVICGFATTCLFMKVIWPLRSRDCTLACSRSRNSCIEASWFPRGIFSCRARLLQLDVNFVRPWVFLLCLFSHLWSLMGDAGPSIRILWLGSSPQNKGVWNVWRMLPIWTCMLQSYRTLRQRESPF